MTLSTTSSVQKYNGDGATTVFAFPYEFFAAAHLQVSLVDIASGTVTPQTIVTNYTVSGAGNPAGGAVTMLVAPALGQRLNIQRVVPLLQTVDFQSGDTFSPTTLDQALDYITMALQQIEDLASGASIAPVIGGGNTFLNLGAGHGVYAQTIGSQVQLKGIVQGANITITEDATGITIAGPGLAGALTVANNLTDVAARQTALNNLTAVAGATNEFVLTKDTASGNAIWKVVPTGGAGEANTASNLGAGLGLWKQKVGVDLQFKSLVQGANITLTSNANDVTIAATGEANSAVNIGVAGTGIFTSKSGVNIQLKGIAGGNGITVTNNATDITASVNQAFSPIWTGAHTFQVGGALPLAADYGMTQTAPNPAYITRIDPGTRNDAKVGAALVVASKVSGGGAGNYAEWNAILAIEDHSNGSTGNVPLYTKGFKYGTSAMWAGVFEASNRGGSLVGNLYGMEIDLISDGDCGASAPSFPSGHIGIGLFYGAKTNTGMAGAATKQGVGVLIQPAYGGRDNLYEGVAVRGAGGGNGALSQVDRAYTAAAIGLSAYSASGQYSVATIDLSASTASPIGIDLAPGSWLKFRSGTSGGATVNAWYFGAFVPTWFGAIAIKVDATTCYIPVCSNHP